MSNNITTIVNGGSGNGILSGPHHGLKTTVGTVTAAAPTFTVPHSISGNGFAFTQPRNDGVLTIKTGKEDAQIDATLINDLRLLLEVIQEIPDEHPLGDLKHDIRMRRAFKKLGG
jgi:hypothetical protein